jgi:hypothetical protein
MIKHDELDRRVVPFARRWHVIHDIDVARLVADHTRLRGVCDQLEGYADALPDGVSDAEADAVCQSLRAIVPSHPDEENAVIEALFARHLDDPLTATLVARVRERHLSDAVLADDILAVLHGVSPPCAEAFAYMLRGFFDGCRRTMDFTEIAILTLGGKRFTRDAREMLVEALCGRHAA